MTSSFKAFSISDSTSIAIPAGPTSQRSSIYTSIIQWTNTGSQSYSVLAGPTPTLTNTSWTAPAGVTQVEVLVVAGGGGASGSSASSGGGGGGGLIYNSAFAVTPGTAYTITVGAGGTGGTGTGTNGSNSVFNNLITNGTFTTNTTGWITHPDYVSTVLSIDTNRLKVLGGGAQQSFSTEIGKTYVLAYTLTAFNPGGVYLGTASTGSNGFSYFSTGAQSTGIYSYTFTATSTIAYVTLFAWNAGSEYAFYDNVSVSEVGSTAIGGGAGGGANNAAGLNGGSGGGGRGETGTAGGLGTAGQGFAGGAGLISPRCSGGGGGAGGRGSPGIAQTGGGGGPGLAFNISGTTAWYAGGGGGGNEYQSIAGAGGVGGGGAAGVGNDANGTAGTASTGGGGGGCSRGASGTSSSLSGGAGGSGIVIIKYTVTSENLNPIGITRFNTESRQLEVYQGTYLGWVGQDTSRNFAGHNLFTFSSTFTNASWLANNSTTASSASISPDGSSGVFTAIPSAGNTTHQLYHQTGVAVTAVPYTFSIHAKANGYTQVRLADVSTGNGVWFNLSAGTVGTATAGFTGRIIPLGNGWYRCSITFTPSAGTQNYGIYLGNNTESASFAGDGTSGLLVWGAQLEQSASAGPYVKTAGVASPIPTVLNGYRTHTYTTTGTSGFTAANTGTVEVLVVGAGGAGRQFGGGGGGGGGVIYQTAYAVVSEQEYNVVVGAGAADASGGNSQFASLIAIGGGASGADNFVNGRQGGSGGGAGTYGTTPYYGAPGINGQGFGGGHNLVNIDYSGGGGGAGGPGRDAYSNGNGCGVGGPGVACSISGTLTFYGGGGGGAPRNSGSQSPGAPGGIGGGGAGSTSAVTSPGVSGTANTGGGGGGGVGYPSSGASGAGGSGIVIVRYKYD